MEAIAIPAAAPAALDPEDVPLGPPVARSPWAQNPTRRCLDCGAPTQAGRFARWCPPCRPKHRGKRPRWPFDAARDAKLRERYATRGPVALAKAWGYPKWAITKRASFLGLIQKTDRRYWTPEEEAFLMENVGRRTVTWLARRLKRGTTSVVMKLKHLQLSRRIRDGYTVRDLQLALGIDHHPIDEWIRSGKLRATRRHGGETAAFDRDAWHVSEEDLLVFLRDHRTAYRLDRVDQEWFLGLVLPPRAEAPRG